MNIKTSIGIEIHPMLLKNYFRTLVNQIYKILPMREAESQSLSKYIWRLTAEIAGGTGMYPDLQVDSYYASLLNILQYLNEHNRECTIEQTKQLVFEGIRICEKLSEKYAGMCEKHERHDANGGV